MPTFLILMCGLTLESVYPRARIGGARALKVVERYSTSVCSTTLPTFHSLHISACLASHLSLSLICPFTHPLLLTYVFLFMFPSYCLYFWFNSAVIRLHSKSKLTLCIAITVHFPSHVCCIRSYLFCSNLVRFFWYPVIRGPCAQIKTVMLRTAVFFTVL